MSRKKNSPRSSSLSSKAVAPLVFSKSQRTLLALLGGLLGLIILVGIAVIPRLLETATPTIQIGGPFSLVDTQGKTVTDADFHGRLMLIYFGYTFCPDVCPTTLGVVSQAYDKLSPEEQKQIVPIFITVDPERDTVDQMATYIGGFSPALVGLTGSPEQVEAVVKAYKVYARKADNNASNYSVDHSSILFLMGRDGKFVAHFTPEASAQVLAEGLRKHL